MSIRKGLKTIASSVPVTEWGNVDGILDDQVDLKSALDSKAPTYSPTFTGTPLAPTPVIGASDNQIATTKYVQDALLNAGSDLPDQSGQSGKFLTTNGSIPSWATVEALPSQSGKSGKFLTTNGTTASWGSIPTEIPSQSGNSGKFLTTNGSSVSWGTINALTNSGGGNGSLSILGSSSHACETLVGYGTSSTNAGAVAVGYNATIQGADSTAIGYEAHTTAACAIQIGEGTNSTPTTLSIGFGELAGTVRNYTLLNGSTGKIPDDRLNNPIPSQSGNNGKFLTTNGSAISWASVPTPTVDQTYNSSSSNAQSGTAVASAISSVALTNGNDISISNKAINYTGPKYYRLATRSWTYSQWTQYCERGVTSTVNASFTITGLKTGDLVSVEGLCTDRGNATALAWGIVSSDPDFDSGNVSVTFLGLNIQDSFYVPNPIQVVSSLPASPDANTIYIVTGQ